MNWEAVGAVGEVLGAAGVIITLAYLALQIRQNSEHIEQNVRSQKLSASASLHHDVMQLRLAFVTNPDLMRTFGMGRADPSQLTGEERTRFMVTCTMLFEQLAFAFDRRQEGTADWAALEHYLSDYVSSPGVRLWWRQYGRTIVSADFAAEVERQIAAVQRGEET